MVKINYIGKCVLIDGGKERILVVGDLHFGYAERLKIGGVEIEEKRFLEMIEEFDEIFLKVGRGISKIVLLGDLKHGFSELSINEREELGRFFDYLGGKCGEIVVIRGNHDNYLLNITKRRGLEIKESYFGEGCFFMHGDQEIKEMLGEKVGVVIMAHLHPIVELRGGVKSEKYKCFLEGNYKGKKIIILPSFADVGGGLDVREIIRKKIFGFNWKKFNVLAIGEKSVLDFGELGKIS
ncbi:MAG: metallophosphoesterase [Nanoarchaeota archaeon]